MLERPSGIVLLRPAGELATKSKRTRQLFFGTLRDNLGHALEQYGIGFELSHRAGRLTVYTNAVDQACAVLPRVFGLASVSPVEVVCEASLPAIVEAGRTAFSARLQGKTYAVRSTRHG